MGRGRRLAPGVFRLPQIPVLASASHVGGRQRLVDVAELAPLVGRPAQERRGRDLPDRYVAEPRDEFEDEV